MPISTPICPSLEWLWRLGIYLADALDVPAWQGPCHVRLSTREFDVNMSRDIPARLTDWRRFMQHENCSVYAYGVCVYVCLHGAGIL
jgi:hypothetical protein